MTFFRSLSAAGFAATAISYGPARMGFGLFVPKFRQDFSLSSSSVGLLSTLGFSGFFLGLLVAQFLLHRRGPKVPVLSGLTLATVGLGVVSIAPNVTVLALGVFLAATSAGFAWTPFNDAVHRKIRDVNRPTALSEISTGTSVGITLAGVTAFAMVVLGFQWRICWALFAAASAVALVANWVALRQVDKSPDPAPDGGWRDLLRPVSVPLFGIAFVFGVTSSIYISFAADHFSQRGLPGLPDGTTPAMVFILYGIFGLAGLVTGRARNLVGLLWLLRLLLVTGALSLAFTTLLAGSWPGLVLSAGLQGVNVMMLSAILAFWSERLFPDLPSLSFTTVLLAMATGSVAGPVLAGIGSDTFSTAAMFLGASALPLATAAILPARMVRERPKAPGQPGMAQSMTEH